MKRSLTLTFAAALTALSLCAPAAHAATGSELIEPNITFTGVDGSAQMQAGSHPFATTVGFQIGRVQKGAQVFPEGHVKDVIAELPPGFIGNPTATSRCSGLDFANINKSTTQPACPDSSAIGLIDLEISLTGSGGPDIYTVPVYNLIPPPGRAVKLGFVVFNVPVVIEGGLSQAAPYVVRSGALNISQAVNVFGTSLELWGNPAGPVHDPYRGHCEIANEISGGVPISLGECPVSIAEVPFITLPTSCRGPQQSFFETDYWEAPAPPFIRQSVETNDGSSARTPLGFNGCGRVALSPSISSQPTSKAATSPSGLDFSLDFDHNEGILNPSEEAIADSDVEKAVVTLPEGVSINPSQAEGLNVCSEADLARETATSDPGDGCPQESKIGSVVVETPVLDEPVNGTLYVAKPYENPAHSLIALYLVLQNEKLGITVQQTLRVTTDPRSGQITTYAEEIPELPFSHFKLHFREGTRSPLVTPPACGTYQASATLYPYSGNPPATTTSAFQIISGPDGSPCPKGGLPPFHPELQAGTLNNAAGRFSPFNVKMTRTDSEQEITHFSIKLPPGVAGKLAGIPFCSDAQIARAASRTGPHGGQEELDNPSCPAQSQVGRTLAGSGVGPSLVYAPGKVYLSGPYRGAPISFVSITAGVVGPFDIGTVVVRLAIRVNPETGEVFLDSVGSDPIPHIIQGIPIHLRDIRAYTDRPEFTFNPTSCERKATAATVLGSGLDFVSEADDNPFVSTSPFQAADCAALPFKPKLSLSLIGGTKRGDFPALKAFLRMNGFGEAGIARARVTLPRSEFIANKHFQTICTRVQFKQQGGNGEACPAGSIYGWAKAKSPVLSDPLEGPIFLRSSEHELPDVVASLRGQEINVHLVGHVDSVKGQLRNTFETVPDAPVEWASFSFRGAKKGLFENSTNLCVGKHRAKIEFTGQNGKLANYNPAVKVKCKGKAKKHDKKAKGPKRAQR